MPVGEVDELIIYRVIYRETTLSGLNPCLSWYWLPWLFQEHLVFNSLLTAWKGTLEKS